LGFSAAFSGNASTHMSPKIQSRIILNFPEGRERAVNVVPGLWVGVSM
jgi:hypothetical protein